MIDPKKWFVLMCAAKSRNEDPIWERYKALGTKRELYADVVEDLEATHNAAVETADIVAEKAYIRVFRATYEKTQREAYGRLAPPSLAAHYRPKDRPPDPAPRIYGAGIDPNKWYGLMCDAQNRNEEMFWRALRPFGGKDLNMVDELLDKARLAAVEAANLAAELAYIHAFNKAYDNKYQVSYERRGLLNLASEIIHSKEFKKKNSRVEKSSSQDAGRAATTLALVPPQKKVNR